MFRCVYILLLQMASKAAIRKQWLARLLQPAPQYPGLPGQAYSAPPFGEYKELQELFLHQNAQSNN